MSVFKLQNKTFDINAKHRYLNFTAYHFDRKQFNSLVEKYFKSNKNPFRYIKYQYERNYNPQQDQMDIHIQGVLILKDATRIGKYLKAGEKNRKKDIALGVKGLLQMNKTHFEGVASIEDSVRYTGKDYNKCSLYHKKPIDPNDPLCCVDCNESCKKYRTLVRYDSDSGPFEYGTYIAKNITKIKKNNKTLEDDYLEEVIQDILDGKLIKDQILVKYIKKINNGCWKSCNIYIFGYPRTGKSYLFCILFPKAYEKPSEDPKWWPNFNGQEEVIINEVDGNYFKWKDLLNILDREERGYKKTNRKYFSVLNDRFDYVIEYYKYRVDEKPICENEYICCKVKRIFHKGSKASFNNQEFEIEFNDKVDEKAIISIMQKKDGLLFKKSNRYYWRPEFKFDRTKYILTDCENFNGIEADIIVYPAIVEKLRAKNSKEIEIIDHKEKYKELFESDTTKNNEVQEEESSKEDLSDINSDDSDYTHRKKKSKSVVDSITKNLIATKKNSFR
ncbi:1280_t:CDS:2, partial [Dentiscutata erythropus]